MLIKTKRDGFSHPLSSEITDPSAYSGRRGLIKLMASGLGRTGRLGAGRWHPATG